MWEFKVKANSINLLLKFFKDNDHDQDNNFDSADGGEESESFELTSADHMVTSPSTDYLVTSPSTDQLVTSPPGSSLPSYSATRRHQIYPDPEVFRPRIL
jgi:hypothetical protein